ncbi:DUF2167 domain-containing protein [Oleiagrimonas sp. MCCC 1A03011]|uniref:DUF2167 domain-containing protein n=1 Tax=Oleiagrimonas sp. MCCC 1A03011 TaxID=1926883 RepID=UPI000DC594D4|nr:DUF2167 domain-containing protein [Oleiagrimonas sp. MCCC 1A03011]RAP58136.1 hypothetical protein BTJ49_03890 [Oleiagrimonas sp. MCCC 1A03011]
MFRRMTVAALACLLLSAWRPALAGSQPLSADQARALLHALQFRQGRIAIPAAHASLQLTSGFSFLDAADARKVLEQLWRNPPDTGVLGMIVPGKDARGLVADDGYAVVITYTGDGYVSDKNAADIDYDELLENMQKATRDRNAERRKQGYRTMTLVGWAEPPHYDRSHHKLYWAKDLRVDGMQNDALNYDIRALGRHGYLSLNAVAGMGQLASVKTGMQQILPMVDFDQGSRYADFDRHSDHIAAYGISALIAGGLAAKAGLFAKLFAVLLAAKKLVIAGVAAAAAFLHKLFKRKQA